MRSLTRVSLTWFDAASGYQEKEQRMGLRGGGGCSLDAILYLQHRNNDRRKVGIVSLLSLRGGGNAASTVAENRYNPKKSKYTRDEHKVNKAMCKAVMAGDEDGVRNLLLHPALPGAISQPCVCTTGMEIFLLSSRSHMKERLRSCDCWVTTWKMLAPS